MAELLAVDMLETDTHRGAHGQIFLGRFALSSTRSVVAQPAFEDARFTLDSILRRSLMSEAGAVITARANPVAWLRALPMNFQGAYLRARSNGGDAPPRAARAALPEPRTLRLSEVTLGPVLRRRAAAWAHDHAAASVTELTARDKAEVRRIITAAIKANAGPDRLATRLVRELDLTSSQRDAADAFMTRLLNAQGGTVVAQGDLRVRVPADGVSPERATAWASRYERGLLEARAASVASFEWRQAMNQAQRLLWLERHPNAEHVWRPRGDSCPVCAEMIGETSRLNTPFELPTGEEVDGPPAHPHCDCFTELFVERRG